MPCVNYIYRSIPGFALGTKSNRRPLGLIRDHSKAKTTFGYMVGQKIGDSGEKRVERCVLYLLPIFWERNKSK